MRIVGGQASGARIAAPKGSATRPTGERVREAVFNALAAQVPGSRVLDLYAGTGAMGLEALSRGARQVVWVERDRETAALIRQNWRRTRLWPADGRILVGDAAWALRRLAAQGYLFDLVFCDPPWRLGLPAAVAARLAAVVAPDSGRVVLEVERGSRWPVPFGLEAIRTREYGRTQLVFYRRANMQYQYAGAPPAAGAAPEQGEPT